MREMYFVYFTVRIPVLRFSGDSLSSIRDSVQIVLFTV